MNEQEIKNNSQHNEIDELRSSLDVCKQSCQEWKDKYVHVSADLQNYKRRIEKEQAAWIDRAQGEVLVRLLSIVDDFDRALSEHYNRERTPDLDQWLKGFELIGKELYKFLQDMQVTEIKDTIYFDPTLHEAIVQVEDAQRSSGEIVDVIQKGFMFKDRVLRPAKVTVAK
jgi:molecular chaperone GrpE